MEKMRKLSILVRKKDPLSFPDIAPLFNKLIKHNKELRNNWDEFKQNTLYLAEIIMVTDRLQKRLANIPNGKESGT